MLALVSPVIDELIMGSKTMQELGVKYDFSSNSVEIDGTSIPIKRRVATDCVFAYI